MQKRIQNIISELVAPTVAKKCYNAEYAVYWTRSLSEQICKSLHSEFPDYKVIIECSLVENRYHTHFHANMATVNFLDPETDLFLQLDFHSLTFSLFFTVYMIINTDSQADRLTE